MGISVLGMKTVVLLMAFLALVSPTFSINQTETPQITGLSSGDSDQPLPLSPPARDYELASQPDRLFRCPRLLTQQMVDKVIGHVKTTGVVKSILKKIASFGVCVAGQFCDCARLRLEPLIGACFGVVGGLCMTQAINGTVYDCILGCANRMKNNNRQLDDGAIGDICYGKCMKN